MTWTITTACQAWRVRAITRPDPSNHILDRNVSKMTKIPLWLKRGGVPGYGLIETSATESDWVAIWWLFFSSLTRFTLSTKIIKMHTNALKIVPAHVRECHSVRRIRSKPFFPRCAKSMKFSQNTFWISDFFQTGGRTHAIQLFPVHAPLFPEPESSALKVKSSCYKNNDHWNYIKNTSLFRNKGVIFYIIPSDVHLCGQQWSRLEDLWS